MKYVLLFLVVCVALAAAAPATWVLSPYTTGFVAPFVPPTRTLVAGPTVVNGVNSQITYPGYVGPAFF